ncbi:DUF6153 family protein [Amycolatopsis sp. NPDC003865]
MTANRFGNARRIVLLCALAFCVVAMHHVPSAHGMPATTETSMHAAELPVAASGDHGPGMPAGLHDVLHLCLAVLAAAGALLAALLVWSQLRTPLFRPARPRGSPAPGRPPDRAGRTVLASLCVSRT